MSARPPVIVLSDCCDLHGRNCEPPSELCCWLCTESDHPDHRKRVPCSAPNLWCYSHTCPNGPMPHLANASCSTGRDTKDTMTTPPAEPCRASVRIGCPDSPATLVCHQPAPHPGLNHYDAAERIYWQRTDAEPWLLASPAMPVLREENTMTTPRRCWSQSGAHFFAKESDGVYVCQICGDVKPIRPAAVPGRDPAGGAR